MISRRGSHISCQDLICWQCYKFWASQERYCWR